MSALLSNEVFSAIAMVLTFVAFYPFIRAILKGKTRPHVFSWFIWAADFPRPGRNGAAALVADQ